jgi:aromatic ring hydroxylase
MFMTGKEYLQSIRDGRVIYVGKERVKDQTTHPAFADAARTYAALFNMKSDPALRDLMTFEEGGECYSMYYLQPRSQEDLRRRNRAHRKIADFCFGLMGRTPNAFAGNLTGLSLKPQVFDSEPGGSRNNLLAIYQHVRRNDLFATYAIVPPQVPWEKVIVHDNPALSRNIYIQTAAHVISNHQSNVRFGSKLRFMLGVASLITRFTGARDIPAVRDTLGRLAAMEAGYNAMIDGQIEAYQPFDNGFVIFNRRYLYAAIHWAMENHSQLIDIMRELMGGGQFQFPASIDVVEDPELRDLFETFWTAGEFAAADRMKLFKLAWDLIGSDHASRATSYEKFFVGPAFAVRNYNFANAPWDELHAAVEGFMDTYGTGESVANTEPNMEPMRQQRRS